MNHYTMRLARNFWGGLMIAGVLVLCRCSQPAQEEIYGRYVLESPNGTEYLTLDKDGTYSQQYESKDGTVRLSQTERWTYQPERQEVNLQDPLLIYDVTGKLNDPAHIQGKGLCGLLLTRELGAIRININEDLGIYFKKL